MYEPKGPTQRCQQLVCSKNRAILIVGGAVVFIIIVALIAALARPSPPACSQDTQSEEDVKPEENDFIATNGEKFPWTSIRLPDTVIPVSYDLYMHPDLVALNFKGHVNISVTVSESTDFMIIHKYKLNYTTVVLTDTEANKPVEIKKTLEYVKFQQFMVMTKNKLQKGKQYVLTISFYGDLADNFAGFYKSSYTNKEGEKR